MRKLILVYLKVVVFFILFLFFSSFTVAHESVVVVPLGGTLGDATNEDVVKGKTFSSKAAGNGVTGVRPISPVPKSGQTNCTGPSGSIPCTGTGQDGDTLKGSDWPVPRFTDNNNGTITDNLTDLTWLKNANCFGYKTWLEALNDIKLLADGFCGLTDGSRPGNWRLPNAKELHTLVTFAYTSPSLCDTYGQKIWTEGNAFSKVQVTEGYWTSTHLKSNVDYAWYVDFNKGKLDFSLKSATWNVWPVRDPY